MQDIFEISMGKFVNKEFAKGRQVGAAFYKDTSEKHFYRLELWQFKGQSFYLTKNKDNLKYTLFSEIVDPGPSEAPVFQKPIGYGYQTDTLPEFIQVQLNFPWEKCFLNLRPVK